jgi:hypothetical protein
MTDSSTAKTATDNAAPATKPVAKPASKTASKPTPKAAAPKAATKTVAPAKPKAVAAQKPAKPAKAVKASAAAPAKAKPAAAPKPAKAPKQKLVRDSFTFPETEYLTLVALKKRLLAAGTEVKKGELVRAGLALLNTLDDAALATAVARVEKLKTGRPAK